MLVLLTQTRPRARAARIQVLSFKSATSWTFIMVYSTIFIVHTWVRLRLLIINACNKWRWTLTYLAKDPFNLTMPFDTVLGWTSVKWQSFGSGSSNVLICWGWSQGASRRQKMAARFGVVRGYVWWRTVLLAAGSLRRCLGSVRAQRAEAAFFRCIRNLLLLGVLNTAPSILTHFSATPLSVY